jgi:ketosteroid isomerase-like protein
MQAFYAALLLTLLPATPNQPTVRVDWSQATAAHTEIAALRGEYVEAVNAGDVARASRLYTADALTVLCNGTLVRGNTAVGSRITERSHGNATVTLRPRRFSHGGAVASETGTFIETMAGSLGNTTVEGVYVTVYSRSATGEWRIALEVRTTGHTPALTVW